MATTSSPAALTPAALGATNNNDDNEEYDALRVDISTHTAPEHDSSGNTTPTHQHPATTAEAQAANSAALKSSNVFIAGLPSTWGSARLKDLLQPFGALVSVRVVPERHYAFAQFATVESAQQCIKALHDTKVSPTSNTTLHVCVAMHSEGSEEIPNSRLFLRGLPPFATRDDLKRIGAPFGVVLDATVIVHPDGKCKGSGFIAFDDVDSATLCLNRLSGKLIPFGDPLSQTTRSCEVIFKYCETDEQRAARTKSNKERVNRRQSVASTASATVTPCSSVHARDGSQSPHPATAVAAFGIAARSIPVHDVGARAATPSSNGYRSASRKPADNPLSDSLPPSPQLQQGKPVNTLFLRAPTPAFPRSGDVLISAPSLTAAATRELLAGIIDPPLFVCPFRSGFALRLSQPEWHQVAIDALHEAQFANGECLRVERIVAV